MPAISNITVKKSDGTTDVVYTAMNPSSGDGTPAVWKSLTVGTAPAHQPELRISARDADRGVAREVRGTYKFPETSLNTTTGVTSVVNVLDGSFHVKFSKGMASTTSKEGVYQLANLIASAAVKALLESGYSAT